MDHSGHVALGPGVRVDPDELRYSATRAGGPGGQHVNRSATRIELVWSIAESRSLEPEARDLLMARLASRLDATGSVRIVAADTRSQYRNRRIALDRLKALVRDALDIPRPRKATRPTRASVERRLAEKQRRSERKRDRQDPEW